MFAAFGQQSTVIGTIDRFVGNEIQVKTPSKVVTLISDDRTVVSRGKTYQGSLPLKAGDEISARCERNGANKAREQVRLGLHRHHILHRFG